MTVSERVRLYTFSISHFSEKIRWTLTHERIPFDEIPWTPALHVLSARRAGGATTVPILEAGRVRVQDSTAILEWLDVNRGPLSLLPRDPRARGEAMALESRFDDVGIDVIRVAYDHVFPRASEVVRLWTLDANAIEAATVRVAFPIFRAVYGRRLGMSAAQITAACASIERALALIEARLATGASYLVGEQFSIADVSAAALLAPFACPDEHPVYGSTRYREGMRELVAPWSERGAFAWVRRMFREHRGVWPRATELRQKLDR